MTLFTSDHLIRQVKHQIKEIDVQTLKRRLDAGDSVAVIDVRELDEYAQGALPGARHIPRGYLELEIETVVPDHGAPIALYCETGIRSALGARSLQEMGYTDVVSVAGGFDRWKSSGYSFEIPRLMTDEQRRRYSRHTMIPEIGEQGQLRLLDAKALLIGAGGLGSPAAMYLAAAGVGTLGIVDFDVVDVSNLQRQILHQTDDVGRPKVETAAEAIAALNPDVTVVPHRLVLRSDNAMDVIRGYDVVINGSDNFPTRYLVNDACAMLGIPLVDGSIYRFEGQVAVFDPARGGPCYRCVYPDPPPPGEVPSCAEGGVLGVLPGIVGSLQASEALKLILGIGEPLAGRLLLFDALEGRFRQVKVHKNPACPVCGENPTITQLIDYEEFCGLPRSGNGNGTTAEPVLAPQAAR
jgi:molybdopterin/thiamine biosynthesis adenylyltransferase/rhodanese-related sulfurtransferase